MNDQSRSVRSVAPDLLDEASGHNTLGAQVTHLETDSAGMLACYRDKRGDGGPVLLLHSINAAASSYEMKPLFDHYRGKRPVYALDLPGFGASSHDDVAYTRQRYAAAIERVIVDVIGAERGPVTVIALSLSCEFTARVALLAPDLVRSLVYLSPTGLAKRQTHRGPEALESLRRRFFGQEALVRPLFRALTWKPTVRYFLAKSFEGDAPADLVEHAVAAAHTAGAWRAPAAFLSGALFTPNALRELYAKVSAPQLVIHGKDAYTDFGAVASLLATRTSGVELAVLPTKGMPHWEHTRRVVEAIESFEATHPAPNAEASR